MPVVLNVAEKNDAAKGIAAILSGGQSQRRDGPAMYNKLYCFNTTWRGDRVNMVVTSVSGHLLAVDFAEEFSKWDTVAPSRLFDAPIREYCPQDNDRLKANLQIEARKASVLVIWTDCDREGEKIGYEVASVCQGANRNLDIYRAVFSEITGAAIHRAFANVGRLDPRVRDAVDARIELDLRTGAAFTRLQTLRLRRDLPQMKPAAGDRAVVSYGSCQFPTLGFVVERYKRIQEFIPETFWKITVGHTRNEIRTEFLWKRVRLFAELPVQVLFEMCQEHGIAKVVDVRTKPKSRWRPVALETVELEKLGSRKLRISAKDTMTAAEKLYTKGFISYPRTETNIFPDNLNLQNLVQVQTGDYRWGVFAQGILQQGLRPRNGNKTDQAHPPIHPLKLTAPQELQGNEEKVYELVVRHFLACLSSDATGVETLVELDIGGELFTGTGLVITDRGYLEVYPYDQWSAKSIAVYNLGEEFRPDEIRMNQGQTNAPKLLTEADLIALMDKYGIGTDATHTQHIETVKNRSYVGVQNDGRFIPGYLGLGLVDGYDGMGYRMSKPNLRAEFEADLKLICSGAKTKAEVLRHYIHKYREIFMASEQLFPTVVRSLQQYFPPGGGGPLGPPGFQMRPAYQAPAYNNQRGNFNNARGNYNNARRGNNRGNARGRGNANNNRGNGRGRGRGNARGAGRGRRGRRGGG